MNLTKNNYYYSNFLEFYESSISPKLCEIDLFIKTSDTTMDPFNVAEILYITHKELAKIMISNNITEITVNNFFDIMSSGSSYICKLFCREKECGSPYTYTIEQISYIYDLDIKTITNICTKLNINKITNYSLPLIFSQISIKDE